MTRAWWIVLAACAHAPPPPASKPVARPAATVAEIAGKWLNNDGDLDFHMVIDAGANTIDVWINRGKTGRCEQKGTIAPSDTVGKFRIVYAIGQCNAGVVNVPIDAMISSTAEKLTIVVGDDRSVYERAPDPKDDDSERPAALKP